MHLRSGLCPAPHRVSLQPSPDPLAGGEGLIDRQNPGYAVPPRATMPMSVALSYSPAAVVQCMLIVVVGFAVKSGDDNPSSSVRYCI